MNQDDWIAVTLMSTWRKDSTTLITCTFMASQHVAMSKTIRVKDWTPIEQCGMKTDSRLSPLMPASQAALTGADKSCLCLSSLSCSKSKAVKLLSEFHKFLDGVRAKWGSMSKYVFYRFHTANLVWTQRSPCCHLRWLLAFKWLLLPLPCWQIRYPWCFRIMILRTVLKSLPLENVYDWKHFGLLLWTG